MTDFLNLFDFVNDHEDIKYIFCSVPSANPVQLKDKIKGKFLFILGYTVFVNCSLFFENTFFQKVIAYLYSQRNHPFFNNVKFTKPYHVDCSTLTLP